MDINVSLVAAFVSGLLTFVSPCILPIIPAYVSFITGVSFGGLSKTSGDSGPSLRVITFLHGLAFVAGFSLVFVIIGAGATTLGIAIMRHIKWFRILGGAIVVFFGLMLTGLIKLPLLQREMRFHMQSRPAGYFGSILVGAVFASGWTPCVGPILGSILILAGTQTTVSHGILLLAVYSAGLAVPFLAATLVIEKFAVIIKKYGRLARFSELVAGCILVALGILMFSGRLAIVSELPLRKLKVWTELLSNFGL